MGDSKEMENVTSFGSWLETAVWCIEEKRLDRRSPLRQAQSFIALKLFLFHSTANFIMLYPVSDS